MNLLNNTIEVPEEVPVQAPIEYSKPVEEKVSMSYLADFRAKLAAARLQTPSQISATTNDTCLQSQVKKTDDVNNTENLVAKQKKTAPEKEESSSSFDSSSDNGS